jgi:hypothetical protein
VNSLINVAIRYRDRIDPAMFAPQVNWRAGNNERRIVNALRPELLAEKVAG